MSRSQAFGPLRYVAVVFGAGLMGYAIAGAVGFVMGLGAGLMVSGFAAWLGARIAAPCAHRVVLDSWQFGRLVRGQWVAQPGIRIVLADIGFDVMGRELRHAEAESVLRHTDVL